MRRFLFWVIFLCTVFFCGCGQKTTETVSMGEGEIFNKEFVDIPEDSFCVSSPMDISLKDGLLYTVQAESHEDEEECDNSFAFFARKIESKENVLDFEYELGDFFYLSSFLSLQGNIYVLSTDGESLRVSVLTQKGEEINSFPVLDKGLGRETVNRVFVTGGNDIVLYGNRELFFVDNEGMVADSAKCPEGYVQTMFESTKGLMITSYDENSKKAFIFVWDYEKKRFAKKKEIPGDGRIVTCNSKGEIVLFDAENLYRYTPENETLSVILNFSANSIASYKITAMEENENGFTVIFTSAVSDRKLNGYYLSKMVNGGTDAVPKKQVVIYDPTGNWSSYTCFEIVQEFNEENPDFEVVVDSVEKELNLLLESEECPDMIFGYGAIELEKAGYLADLIPLVEESETYSLDMLRTEVVRTYKRGNAMYRIPIRYSLDGLVIKASDDVGEPWTPDNFLRWLEERQNVISNTEMSKAFVVQYGLMYGIDEYVDAENGTCNFTDGRFAEFIKRINELKLSRNIYSAENGDFAQKGIPCLIYYTFNFPIELTALEYQMGERAVIKGFPTTDGEMATYLWSSSFGILKTSGCQKEAWKFLEYALTHQPEASAFYSDKTLYDETYDVESVFFDDRPYGVSKEQREMLSTAQEAVRNTRAGDDYIIMIIQQEVSSFFDGTKKVEEVCKVIQSRVSLYLEEKRTVGVNN